jgi:hypothetical protein
MRPQLDNAPRPAIEQAHDLLESEGWAYLMRQVRASLRRYRNGLLTSSNLSELERAEHLGRMRGVFDLLEAVYKDAESEVPEYLQIFFTGEQE